MSDSLRPAAVLADRLGDRLAIVLPEVEPAIDRDPLGPSTRMSRIELRQVAGLAAGGSMALRAGCWDFGPVERSEGRLGFGEPDRIGFTLIIDDDLAATISAEVPTVRLDGEAVVAPTEVAGRMIDAGSARFVLARPRPSRRRSGGEVPPGQIDPWVLELTPGQGPPATEAERLVSQRWRTHLGADGLAHRIESGRSHLWHRGPDHPLFGTAVIGVADLPATAVSADRADTDDADGPAETDRLVAAPVSIDAVGSSTVLTGPRSHQLAVARQILLSLAATAHPRDLRIGLQSELADLAFVRDLPHAARSSRSRRASRRPTLLVVDQDRPAGRQPWSERDGDLWPILADGGALLILSRAGDLAPRGANWVAVADPATVRIETGDRKRAPLGATPVGLGPALADELAGLLSTIEVDAAT